VITGTLESMSRDDARAALEALGAKVSDNVSKKTTAVFVGESPGSKVAKAQKAGVALLGEDELQALLADPNQRRRASTRKGARHLYISPAPEAGLASCAGAGRL
jgi:BRCT domain type II-containing protein